MTDLARPSPFVIPRGGGTVALVVRARGPYQKDAASRFWSKVDRNGPVPKHCPELGPCWIFTGGKAGNGYGIFYVENGVKELAHRFSWKIDGSSIPDGMMVLHKCDNPPCVNKESHLFLGTNDDNVKDCISKGRRKVGAPL